MKYIGFIKEHNPIEEAISIQDIKNNTYMNDRDIVSNVVEYLSNGVLLLAWMGYFMDLEDNKPIAPDSYYTDGVWVWPSYFPYYLHKYPNYLLNEDFVEYLRSKKFNFNVNAAFDKRFMEQQLSLKLNQLDSLIN